MISRRAFVSAGVATPLLGTSVAFAKDADSGLPFVITTGFSPGGNSDVICRAVAEGMRVTGYTGPTVVENKTGAGGQIAVSSMRGKPLNGSSVLMTAGSVLTIYPHIFKQLPYDPNKDLIPATLACRFDIGIAVGPRVPATVTNLAQLIAWWKANPSEGSFGSAGAGSSPHLLTTVLAKEVGIQLTHAAYRGSVPAIQDMLGGQISAVSAPVGEFISHAKSGRVRILAVSGAARNRFLPDVPTLAEQGHPTIRAPEWFGFFLPAGTAAEEVKRTSQLLQVALKTPQVEAAFANIGVQPASSTSAELAAMQVEDTAYWGSVVKRIGFTPEG